MSMDLYSESFGFTERPFTLSPDPDFLFWSPAHKRAFSVLEYGLVTQSPLTVVTGEVGTGKTTLIQALLRQTDQDILHRVGGPLRLSLDEENGQKGQADEQHAITRRTIGFLIEIIGLIEAHAKTAVAAGDTVLILA